MEKLDSPQSITEKLAATDILEQLDNYQALSHQYDRCLSLKENIEKHRQSARTHIYEKVKKEYEEKCTDIEQNRRDLAELLEKHLQDLIEERNNLNEFCQEKTDQLEEIDFRILVGDKNEEEYSEVRAEIKSKLLKLTQELGHIEEYLDKYIEAGLFNNNQSMAYSLTSETAEQSAIEESLADSEGASESSQSAGDTRPEAISVEGERPLEEKENDEQEEKTERLSLSEIQEGFTVVEETATAKDEACPIVQCPTNSEASSKNNQDSSEPSSDFVTGYLIALEGSRKDERFPLISSNITLGSSPGIDIRLNDPGIANFHARIQYKDRKHYLENLDNMGRCFVNAVQVELIELKNGDVIRLGDIKFQVEYGEI